MKYPRISYGKRVVVRGERSYSARWAFGQIFKGDVNGFSSSSDICFMESTLYASAYFFSNLSHIDAFGQPK
jgi:hypothetical protein